MNTNLRADIAATLQDQTEATIRQLCDCCAASVADMHAALYDMYMAGKIALYPHENGARPVDARTAAAGMRLGITTHIYVRSR